MKMEDCFECVVHILEPVIQTSQLKLKISKSKQTSTVFLYNVSLLRFVEKKNRMYITIQDRDESQKKNIDIEIFDSLDLLDYKNEIIQAAKKIRPSISFQCCSRYLECSDAKKCIHPNSDFSSQCGYRLKLENHIIFYGKNRNVD